MNLYNKQPVLGKDVFVAPNAVVVGDVELGNKASVYYGAVLRGAHQCLLGCNYQSIMNPLNIAPNLISN